MPHPALPVQSNDERFKAELGKVIEMEVWEQAKGESSKQLKAKTSQKAATQTEQAVRQQHADTLEAQVGHCLSGCTCEAASVCHLSSVCGRDVSATSSCHCIDLFCLVCCSKAVKFVQLQLCSTSTLIDICPSQRTVEIVCSLSMPADLLRLQVAAARDSADAHQAAHQQEAQELREQVLAASQQLQAAQQQCLGLARQLRSWLAQPHLLSTDLLQSEAAAKQELARLESEAEAVTAELAALEQRLQQDEEV